MKNVVIWGNHSATQYPDTEYAVANGTPVKKVHLCLNWLPSKFRFWTLHGSLLLLKRCKSEVRRSFKPVDHPLRCLLPALLLLMSEAGINIIFGSHL